jgi:sigma-B regulation protein RsbU (phosphoserine phosphatase)
VCSSPWKGTELFGATLETVRPDATTLEVLLRRFVASNPNVFGSTAAFEPFAFDSRRERVSPYICRDEKDTTHLLAQDLAVPTYKYWERDCAGNGRQAARWSALPGCWRGDTLMVTYAVPISRSDGSRLDGVVTADVQLDWLARFIGEIKIGASGYGVMLSRAGRGSPIPTNRCCTRRPRNRWRGSTAAGALVQRLQTRQEGFEPLSMMAAATASCSVP